MLNVQGIINETLKNKEESREEREQNTWYISGFGTSMLERYMKRLGLEPDEPVDSRLLRVFDLGNKIEDWVVELLQADPKFEVDTQIRVEDEKLNISGRLDVLLTEKETGEKIVVELKSKNSRAFWYMEKQGQGAMQHHQMQIWGYLYLLGIEKGHLVYISKDDQAILEYPIYLNNEDLRKQFLTECAILNYCWENKIPPQLEDKKAWQYKYNDYKKQIPAFLEKNPPISDEKLQEIIASVNCG